MRDTQVSMTPLIVSTSIGVNSRTNICSSHFDVTTLLERIEWLVRERAEGNQTVLSERAALGRTRVGSLLTKLRQGPHEPGMSVIVALARAGGVSVDWLATGAGSPTDGAAGPPPADDVALTQLESIPGWSKIVAGARAIAPDIQPWVWDYIARKRAVVTDHPTPAELVAIARVVTQFVPPP